MKNMIKRTIIIAAMAVALGQSYSGDWDAFINDTYHPAAVVVEVDEIAA